jgi:pheromone shutdown-related protein TraB
MITLIGTGHVFNLSAALNKIFDKKKPDVICVELDQQRFNALILKKNDPVRYKNVTKNNPFIYRILARFQDNMAKEYGVSAGDEMLTAINYAKSNGIGLELIDSNAQKLFTKMLKSMTLSEKVKLLISGLGGLFIRKERVEKELKKIQNNFDDYLKEIGDKFPTIKKVLIDERNENMANRIIKLTEKYDKIMACMGDGHIIGISNILDGKNIEYEIIRLKDLRNLNIKSENASFSFNVEYNN